ncbi:MAG: phosphatidylserine decarboxylase [Cyclobacteriaceae bacterium]|jgi:phosphatidylserine decarboxylase
MSKLFIAVQHLVPQHLLSRLVGYVADAKITWIKNTFIRVIIKIFKVDMDEAASADLADYPNFNAFFSRPLKPGLRPIAGLVSSPADGSVSACGDINGNQIIQAKGLNYSVEKLLASQDGSVFHNGSFITIYLSPKDYHRVHNPVAGQMSRGTYVPGKLFSVNDTAAAHIPDLFADNERYVMRFDTDQGAMAVVMVGAMIVAGIQTAWRDTPYPAKQFSEEAFDPALKIGQGDELGRFLMGSTAIILLERRVQWQVGDHDLVSMGQALVAQDNGQS